MESGTCVFGPNETLQFLNALIMATLTCANPNLIPKMLKIIFFYLNNLV